MAFGQLMAREIHDEVDLVGRWAARGGYDVDALSVRIGHMDSPNYVLVGRGTSDNACLYGKYILEIKRNAMVSMASPSTVVHYGARPHSPNSVCVAVSQSGQSPDLVAYLQSARSGGALTVAVTNDPDSPLAATAEHVIDLEAGPEQAVAATKTFTAQLLALHDLFAPLTDATANDRVACAEAVAQVAGIHVELAPITRWLAEHVRRSSPIIVVGRGYSSPIAQESALKIMETCRTPILAYSAADLLHGPVAVLHPGTPVVAICSQGDVKQSMVALVDDLRERGAEVLAIGSAAAEVRGTHSLNLPLCPESLAPVVEVIPLQMIAHDLAMTLGMDPDAPVGLRKVTRTS